MSIDKRQQLIQAIQEMSEELISQVHPFFFLTRYEDIPPEIAMKTANAESAPFRVARCDYCQATALELRACDVDDLMWEPDYEFLNAQGEIEGAEGFLCRDCIDKHGQFIDDHFLMKIPPPNPGDTLISDDVISLRG